MLFDLQSRVIYKITVLLTPRVDIAARKRTVELLRPSHFEWLMSVNGSKYSRVFVGTKDGITVNFKTQHVCLFVFTGKDNCQGNRHRRIRKPSQSFHWNADGRKYWESCCQSVEIALARVLKICSTFNEMLFILNAAYKSCKGSKNAL